MVLSCSDSVRSSEPPSPTWTSAKARKIEQASEKEDLVGHDPSEPSPILRYFVFEHLPPKLQVVSKPFSDLAFHVEDVLPHGPEKSVALRKLLEAKDAAVRAALDT